MTQHVLILGCGPAGLFAAHAAECAGFKVQIASRKRKSEMYGAQYLHNPIPEVSEKEFTVEYRLEGTPQGYRQKVYGPGYRGTVSPVELGSTHQAWDIREAYDILWDHYVDKIVDTQFNHPEEVRAFLEAFRVGDKMAHYVSSIPAPLLCTEPGHGFTAQRVWSVGDAPERGIFSPVVSERNTVTCSGDLLTSWYRKANILGYNTVEWPESKRPPIDGVSEVLKPISHNCTCLGYVHRVGRYGHWTKGVLSDSAFYETYSGLAQKPWS
jgi:hypothetical protein